jgi:antibiotic biosynthesis monooxygenase (ABM) superfamily enzyme
MTTTTTTISTDQDFATLVNVFTVAPQDQKRLIEHLVEVLDTVTTHLPGFVSSNIHASLDGKQVINYAQWRSLEDFDGLMQNPTAQELFQHIMEYATPGPYMCKLVSVYHA